MSERGDSMSKKEILALLLEDLQEQLKENGVKVVKRAAKETLTKKLDEFIESIDDCYDPSEEEDDNILERALELLIEEAGEEKWHNSIRTARDEAYGSTAGWVYENQSEEVISAAFNELSDQMLQSH